MLKNVIYFFTLCFASLTLNPSNSFAAPEHFNDCTLCIEGVSITINFAGAGQEKIEHGEVESFENNRVNLGVREFLFNGPAISGAAQFVNRIGFLLNTGLYMGDCMNDGLNRYLTHRGIQWSPFILQNQEILGKTQQVSQTFLPIAQTIFNVPSGGSLITALESLELDPQFLNAQEITFSLNNSPINGAGDNVTEIKFKVGIHVKDSEVSDTDSDTSL